jgi:nucleotide-binding universal stress UspA family protein
MAEKDTPYTVVVGVSATSKSPTALAWARAQATANGGRLVAVRAFRAPSATGAQDPAAVLADQRARLARDVAEVLGPDHGADVQVVRGSNHRALLEQAEDADLLVIDAPRTPSTSVLLAQRIVSAATCPVVVMPPSISGAPESALSRSARSVGRAALRSAGTSGRAGYRPPAVPSD